MGLKAIYEQAHFAILSLDWAVSAPCMGSPFFKTAPGHSLFMSCSLLPMPLPSWVQSGKTVLLAKL